MLLLCCGAPHPAPPALPGTALCCMPGASKEHTQACSRGITRTAMQIQFLYASLGTSSGGSAASWRAALAALKSDYEKHFKYTGKV